MIITITITTIMTIIKLVVTTSRKRYILKKKKRKEREKKKKRKLDLWLNYFVVLIAPVKAARGGRSGVSEV